MSHEVTASAMEAPVEGLAGDLILNIIFNQLEKQFPGSRAFLDQAAKLLPWSKVWAAIQLATTEWTAGKSFLTILQDVLSQWLSIVPTPDGIRMSLRSE